MRRAVLIRVAALACMAWLVGMLGTASAQEWRKLREEGANFYDVKRSFEKAEAQALQNALLKKGADGEGFEDEAKVPGYTGFKRWEYWMEPRVFPSGDLPAPDQNFKAMQQYFQQHGALMKGAATPASVATAIPAANWTSLGPTSWVLTSNSVAPGLGRVSAITFHPTDPNTIFLGTPAGGLWKSTNGGASWSTNTANLPVLGVSSIVIDPANTNVMYMATGDNDGSDTQSVGVLKSTDGGATWNTTGLNWTVTQTRRIYKLIMHPTNSNILLAATTDGIYKTTDGGATWSRKLSSSWKDIEFKPGDPTVVYAAWTTLMYRSTNTGDNWTSVALPSSAMNRFAIAVTPANPSYVYILASKSADNSFLGLYRSTDSGLTFTTQSTTPNIFGYQTDGLDAGKGQGSYDIAFNVSPTNADEVYIGGVNIWKSTNGGVNWTNKTHWVYNTNPAAYVHADVHLFEFNGSNVYTGTDGGFFKSTDGGTTWTDLSAGMNTTEYYRIASDPNSANLVYGGAQDNTITRYSGSNIWDSFLSGDGAECLVDRTNSNIVYSATQQGSLKRSSNAGVSWSSIKSNITETGAWVTPYVMDPVSNTTLYAGYVNVWKTTNSGTSWTKLSTFANTNTIVDLQVAPSNANYIYVTKTANVYRSSDGGANWTDITAGLPTAAYKQIAVASNNPLKIWITLSGYLSGNKVYASTDGGATWTNYSGTLPNLPFNTIVYHNNGGADALYAGADVGVYYRDNTMSDWELYQTGLPNVPISELEIHENSGKLRAGTFGRGLWQTDLVPPPAAALAFDGSDDVVLVPDAPALNFNSSLKFTLEAWVKMDVAAALPAKTVISKGFGLGGEQYVIDVIPGATRFYVFDGSANLALISIAEITVAEGWVHLAAVFDVSQNLMQLYKNGALAGSTTPLASLISTTEPVSIGSKKFSSSSTTYTETFNGKIDEVRIWNLARSAADISGKMSCELTGTEAGLVAYYKFNQGLPGANNAGETNLIDTAGGDNNGTLNNFALTGTTSNWVTPGGVTSGTTCGTMAMLIANAGNDNPHSGGATKLNGFASGGSGAYTYAWAVASGPNASNAQFSNAAATKTVFTPTATGNYVLRFTAKDAMNAIAVDNVAVQVNALNSASISGPDPVAPASLNSYTVTTDASNPTFLWVVTNGTITEEPSDNPPPGDANTRNPVLIEAGNPNFPMLVEVYVTDGNTNDVTYAFMSVTINNPNALTANAGPDRTIIVGGSATIGGSPSAIGGVPPLTYEWSPTTGLDNPNAANPLASPITSTTYTLTVSDGFGGVATDQVDVNVTVVQVKPFVFLGNKITLARTKQHTPAGDMHSNGTLTASKGDPSTYNSNLTAVSKITINKDNTINGNVKAPSISNSGKINGTKTIGSVANEPLPGLSYNAVGSNKTVPSGGSLTLAPGQYGIVTVNSGGKLKLSSGEYFMKELRASSSNAVIEITITGGNPVTINVVSNFQLGKEGEIRLLPNGESDSKLVTINTRQSTAVSIGREAYFLGNFNAPSAVVTLVKNSQLRGAICAKEIVIDRDCLFLHHDSPGSLPGPGNLPKTPGEVYEVDEENAPVTSYELGQNYPNPFNPETAIRFALPEAGSVTVVLYSLSGQVVRELVNGNYGIGRHEVVWDGRDASGAVVAGGIYFYRLIVHGANGDVAFTQTRKMTFVK